MKGNIRKLTAAATVFFVLMCILQTAGKAATENVQATVMIYMIGSDLESESGCASADLEEMARAAFGTEVNLVLQTGGAREWKNERISEGTCQRFVMRNGELQELENIGLRSMAEPETLGEFIRWGSERFPAQRYELVLWDHGGGTAAGFGYDEYFEEDWLSVSELAEALKLGGCRFELIGFDACLMGTVETAYLLSPYADCMVASEDYVPADGWSYEGWLNALGGQPSMTAAELGRRIASDYAEYYRQAGEDYTISVIDLTKIDELYGELCRYMEESAYLIDGHQFQELSRARAEAKDFGDGDYEQIDICDYIRRVESVDASALKEALDACIIYADSNLSQAGGLAMYYPYRYLDEYGDIWEELNTGGYADGYGEYFNKFASVIAGAQSSGGGQYFSGGEEAWDYTVYDWYDAQQIADYSDVYLDTAYEEQEIIDKGEYYALPMTEEDWELMTYIEQQVYLDDGEGYVELGCDNYYEVDEDGDLIVDFDYYWVSLNGMPVPFYAEAEEYGDEDNWYTYGYVPAELNESADIEIIVRWDSSNEDGYVSGWRYASEGMGQAAAKGLFSFAAGDRIDVWCDYYTYDWEYDGSYYWGEPIYIGEDGLSVSYEDIGDDTTLVNYMLIDIYQNYYYTETVEISIE